MITNLFFTDISCDFELLERKLKEYVWNKEEVVEDEKITCEVFEEVSNVIKVLEDVGFKYVKEFSLNDMYMKNDMYESDEVVVYIQEVKNVGLFMKVERKKGEKKNIDSLIEYAKSLNLRLGTKFNINKLDLINKC